MAIAEAQLETWSAQGKTGQFTDTYNAIRANLVDSSAPYPVGECEAFLQGSYGNDTNVWADSDVDIVLRHKGAFYYEISGMTEAEQQSFKSVFFEQCAVRLFSIQGPMRRVGSNASTMGFRWARRPF